MNLPIRYEQRADEVRWVMNRGYVRLYPRNATTFSIGSVETSDDTRIWRYGGVMDDRGVQTAAESILEFLVAFGA